ncbi:hypothetical protein [Capnocytophaga granulosa]
MDFVCLCNHDSAIPRWCELAARTYNYGACSSRKEPKALLNSRHELQARASRGSLQLVPMIMELVAPIKSQRLYLMVGTSCKLAPAEGINDK